MTVHRNPYDSRPVRKPGEAPGPTLSQPHMIYAVPDIPDTTDDDYTTGYATHLDPDLESGTTPDPIRQGRAEPYIIADPNRDDYNDRVWDETRQRWTQDHQTGNFEVKQQKVPPGQNPMWEQERLPIRPSATRSPTGYWFSRYWHIPRNVKDAIGESSIDHISMADHRRVYEIYGMKPVNRVGVNTYRLDPQPWDSGLFPPDQGVTYAPNESGGAQLGNRAYRL